MRQRILKIAIELGKTRTCACSKYFHICIAFRGKHVLASGQNCVCRVYKKFGHVISTHAEHSTLAQIKDDKPFDLLVVRVNESGTKLLISKPCIKCSQYMNRGYYKIKRVYYSDGDGIVMTSVENLLHKDLKIRHKTPIQTPCNLKCCMAN